MRISILLVIILLALASCEHKDLCYLHPHDREVNVVFDWRLIDKECIPEVMECVFYDKGGRVVGEFPLPPQGGKVKMPDGEYAVIAYNTNGYRNNFEDVKGIRLVSTKKYLQGGNIIYDTPDFLCYCNQKVLLPADDGSRVVMLIPVRKVTRVTYKVNGLSASGGIGSAYAVLSGCSSAFDLTNGYCQERVQHGEAKQLWWNLDCNNPAGVFNMFGCGFLYQERDKEHKHILTLNFINKGGDKMKKIEFDVTSQVPCRVPLGVTMRNFHLEVTLDSDITFDDSDDNSTESTFEPEVEEWDDVEEIIPLEYYK